MDSDTTNQSGVVNLKTTPRLKLNLAASILVLWVLVMVFLFWHFQFRYYSAWISFDGTELEQRQLILEPGKFSVLHFIDESCPCTRFSLPHITDLEAAIGTETVAYQKVIKGSQSNWLSKATPASPSVAVFSDKGELVYFGPYSSGAICGQGQDIVSKILLRPFKKGQWNNQEAVGCFCQWSEKFI